MTGFQPWHYRSASRESALVFPDGCRDVLVVRPPDAAPRVVLTGFDFSPRSADMMPGTEISGYRLRPGACVSQPVLDAIADNSSRTADILGNALADWGALDDAIVALTRPGASVAGVARQSGLSLRSLQRRFQDAQLPPPEFWRLLARARRAVALLATPAPLAEIADASGFSDQAHMSRAMARWFGHSPAQLRRDAGLRLLLAQPALGNWTAEQISTR